MDANRLAEAGNGPTILSGWCLIIQDVIDFEKNEFMDPISTEETKLLVIGIWERWVRKGEGGDSGSTVIQSVDEDKTR